MRIIGCVNSSNASDKRCNEHVDFSTIGRSIYEGEDFTCTYCGEAWKDGLTTSERYERDNSVKHCDHCLSYQPVFEGEKCALCVEEDAQTIIDHNDWCEDCGEDTDCICQGDDYADGWEDYDTSDHYDSEYDNDSDLMNEY